MPIFLGKNKVSCKYLIPTQDSPSTPSAEKKAVNFYDYDGTLLHSYTRDEALTLNELPALPNRSDEGLTCQGWNYTLGDINTDLTANTSEDRWIDIGAMYIPTDGATHINITMADKYRSQMPLVFTGNVTIDWGDGNTQTVNHTSATTVTHNYAIAQSYPVKYTIKLTVNSGTLTLGGGSSSYNICGNISLISLGKKDPTNVYSSRIDSVFIGNGVTSIGTYAFQDCYPLTSITIPNGVTSIDNYAFYYCYALASVTIPDSVTSIGKNAFQYCYALASVTIPDSVTSIGNDAFSYCYSLTSISIPNSITSISRNAFLDCYSLASITIPNSVTSIGIEAIRSCYSLTSITMPNSVTTIDINAFYHCHSLTSITISSGITSIGDNVFGYCYSLASVTIPNNVTSIGMGVFNSCYGIIKYDFSTHTAIPTLADTTVFFGIASDAKIVVPDALYDSWIADTNWATYVDYIVKASEYEEP